MSSFPDHRTLYRLPWNLSDNPTAWLEPTSDCNIVCKACYREKRKASHKPLEEVRDELEAMARVRNFDRVSLAGGDPLTHPDIVRIAAMVAEMGYRPLLVTNGVALTDDLLLELKRVGVDGYTIHIDSGQHRPGWQGASEQKLNELRLEFAERLAGVGGTSCVFIGTVYEDTLSSVPDVVGWAQGHMDKVHTLFFITYRQLYDGAGDAFEFYAGDQKVPAESLSYGGSGEKAPVPISSRDVVAAIRERFPDYSPCAYLNGTVKPDSLKWLLTTRMGNRGRVFGYAGPRFAEFAQVYHHFRHGKYPGFTTPAVLRRGRMACAATWPFDRGIRQILGRYLAAALRRPWHLFRRLYMQSVVIVEPGQLLPDGRMNMCDGCPDTTVHEGELAWSCRLEEQLRHGVNVCAVPKVGGDSGSTP